MRHDGKSKMTALCDLLAAGLIEKDTNADILWTWSYPSVTAEQRELFMRKCSLSEPQITPMVYSQYKRQWHYIYTTEVENSAVLPKVRFFSLVLVTKDFNPEKYEALCKILSEQYKVTGNPSSMLENYLSVVTKGMCGGQQNGSFSTGDYDIRQAYVKSSIKDIIATFGMEVIVVYTALLLKKRVVVYHPKVQDLLEFVRALPTLVWHRQNWSILHPYVHLVDTEEDELKTLSTYVAGFTDSAIEGRVDLYDVFINVTATSVSVSSNAKESLAMGKLHKDMATFMIQSAEDDDNTDNTVIKEIAVKTKELLNNLKSLATPGEDGKPCVTLESLRERKMPPATENFLFNLAAAEGFVQF